MAQHKGSELNEVGVHMGGGPGWRGLSGRAGEIIHVVRGAAGCGYARSFHTGALTN